MEYLNHSLPTLKDNLALDEALLLEREENPARGNILRVWKMDTLAVAMGSGGKINEELHYSICRREQVEVQRRSSGGGTVVVGPGCLLYTLVLDSEIDPGIGTIAGSYERILDPLAEALSRPERVVSRKGISDLALGEMKVSGSAQQRKRRFVLHHGTLLLNMDLSHLPRLLPQPPRQPDYRLDRDHSSFTTNLELSESETIEALTRAFKASREGKLPPAELVDRSLQERFNDPTWLIRR
ncbi:MAG: lipoate--protein ligase family protein [Gemmataceae bacterium]|nr:lipoate--protein ligase family protein [Gemmataceae bacterium]